MVAADCPLEKLDMDATTTGTANYAGKEERIRLMISGPVDGKKNARRLVELYPDHQACSSIHGTACVPHGSETFRATQTPR